MPDTPNALSSETGLSAELVHKALGAVLDFLRQHLGEGTFERVQAAIPGTADFLHQFESSSEGAGGGGLFAALTGLAGKVLGGGAGELTKLLENFARIGLEPEQIESFLPRAIAFIRSHVPADVFEQILARFPSLSQAVPASTE